MEHYVIIGNGIASVGCIEGIRSVDQVSPITVIAAEPYPTYCRPLISYYLEGKTTLQKMPYRPDYFYAQNNVTVLYSKQVQILDSKAHIITLENGETMQYTKLCVATGSSSWIPPIKGLETVTSRHSFLTLDDALGLEQSLFPEAKVLILGAGLIGLKCAEGIHGRVAHITVADLAPRVLSSILDDACAAAIQTRLEENGIQFLLGDTIAQYQGNTALMQSGTQVEFDILVLAVGVRPNMTLVKEAGGAVNRGILIDEQCKTSLPDVYAAGDCTEGFDASLGQKRVLALLPNANLQGHCAGKNMAGEPTIFDQGIPMNSIGFFGLHAMTAGTYFSPEEGGTCYECVDKGTRKRLYSKDDRLTGYILIGNVDQAGIYTALIRNFTPLSSIAYAEMKKNPSFVAFLPEYRRNIFGGVV